MCEYCETKMRLPIGELSITIGTECIIDGIDEDDPCVYVEGNELCLEYEGVIEIEPINFCPKCGRDLRGDAS